VPEFRSTVPVQRCDLMRGRLQKKTGIWKKFAEESAPTRKERIVQMYMGTKENFTLGTRFLAFDSGI
jgi:hypothetical protein